MLVQLAVLQSSSHGVMTGGLEEQCFNLDIKWTGYSAI